MNLQSAKIIQARQVYDKSKKHEILLSILYLTVIINIFICSECMQYGRTLSRVWT
jgi:hypothetical protein